MMLILVVIQYFIMSVLIYPTEKALKNILMMIEHGDKFPFYVMVSILP